MRKILTLCIVQKGDRVLLGMKKRGFGKGKWNGFGGKLKEGEGLVNAMKREVQEEAGISLGEFEEQGVLEFEFLGNPEILETHVFKALNFVFGRKAIQREVFIQRSWHYSRLFS